MHSLNPSRRASPQVFPLLHFSAAFLSSQAHIFPSLISLPVPSLPFSGSLLRIPYFPIESRFFFGGGQMLMSRTFSHLSRTVGRRVLPVLPSSAQNQHHRKLPILVNRLDSLIHEGSNKFAATQVSLFHHFTPNSSPFGRFGFTSSANPEPSEKEKGNGAELNGDSTNNKAQHTDGEAKVSDPKDESVSGETKVSGSKPEPQSTTSKSVKGRRRGTKRIAFSDSDSDSDGDLTMEDMVKLVKEKEELLNSKKKEMEQMQDKVLRTYAEMENVMERTKREAENSKKFAIQNFTKSLLDVADNLGRASSVVKERFVKIDPSNDSAGAVPLLKTLLEGVEMTDKQLSEVFKKYGVEKFDPINEPFDPHRHNAMFQVPDASKPPGTVAHVLKAGYLLYDRVIRPAEVGVSQAIEGTEGNTEGEKGTDA